MHRLGFFCVLLALLGACSSGDDTPAVVEPEQPATATAEVDEELSGGETTVFETGIQAFGLSARNLDFDERTRFLIGNSFFEQNWVIAPASTTSRDGLGPLFNARSCSSCHFRDGRGRPPEAEDEAFLSMLIRLSIPGVGVNGAPLAEPTYGGQLNPQAIPGVLGEGQPRVSYQEIAGSYADGTAYSLRKPIYRFEELGYGDMHPDVMFSPRVAPAMIGLGLLEAIPASSILALADETDADGDGISGRPNWVWNVASQMTVLGRFGWKANQPNVEQQTAAAFLGDIGITSRLFIDENCSDAQADCADAVTGGAPELQDDLLDDVTFYAQTLAVPARRNWDTVDVLRGKYLFQQAGCASCHTPVLETGEHPIEALANQTVRPYTDLLLHDMGEELADHRPDFEATGREWRTPPLWGIGLQQTVNGHTYFLHDGRARNLEEAILWHGGEAEASRESFRNMNPKDRQDLLAFLQSL